MMKYTKKLGLLVALGIGLGGMALATSHSASVTLSGTKPAATTTLAFSDAAGTAVTALAFGQTIVNTAKAATVPVFMKLTYTNFGGNGFSVAFTPVNVPVGYTIDYTTKTGIAAESAATVIGTAFTSTVPTALQGEQTVYMVQATNVVTASGDATQLTFWVTASTAAAPDVSGTLQATVTTN